MLTTVDGSKDKRISMKVVPIELPTIRQLKDTLANFQGGTVNLIKEKHNGLFTSLFEPIWWIEAGTIAFNDFAQNYDRQVTVDQLLNGERKDALAKFSLNDNCALIEKLQASGKLAEASNDQLRNLAEFFVSIESEAAMKLWSAMTMNGAMSHEQIKVLHKVELDDGMTVQKQMHKIYSGRKES